MEINEAFMLLEVDATNLVGKLASEPVTNTQLSELWKRKLDAIDLAQTALREKQERERNEPTRYGQKEGEPNNEFVTQ